MGEEADLLLNVAEEVEHLIHGDGIDSVQAEKATYFRQQLCLRLWRSRISL